MKLTFLGAAHEVTGSCTLIETVNYKILVDCGMEQGPDIYENCQLPVSAGEIDCVILTHAHIDHSGRLPVLTSEGFKGKIYSTAATKRLCSIMLMDSAHIQQCEAEWRNRKAKRSGEESYTPMYTADDVSATMAQFVSFEYNQINEVLGGIKLRFIDAGHLLGSASAELVVADGVQEKTLLFSGDLGNVDRPLICDPSKPEIHADYVVIESTYGGKKHGDRPDYKIQLADIINRTFKRGGNLVIPSFAVGRTQELLYLIRMIKDEHLIKGNDDFPVYLDSPLAAAATEIYSSDLTDYYDSETLELLNAGINPIKFPGLRLTATSEESKMINFDDTPKVIISSSGMCEAGRIRHHLKHNLWRPECTVLFVGYQAEGTLGRTIAEGAAQVKLFGESIIIRAEIAALEGISGHADNDMLLDWLSALKGAPERVFVNHGEDMICDEFADIISKKLGFKAAAPYNGAVYDLALNKCLYTGNTEKNVKANEKTARANSIYRKLIAAGNRLMLVIQHNKGGSNKDLAKFTSQINDMCEKWDR